MSPEIIDVLRNMLERTAKIIPLVPADQVYWQEEAQYAHHRATEVLDKLEQGTMPCCVYMMVAPDLRAVKAMVDRIPAEVFEAAEDVTVIHRRPSDAE